MTKAKTKAKTKAETETAMASALRRAGFDTGSRLHAVIAGCLAAENGDRARAARRLLAKLTEDDELRMMALLALVDAVRADMQGMPGHALGAEEGHPARARQQDAGAKVGLPKGQNGNAPAQEGDGAGQSRIADNGQALAARPSPEKRSGAGQALPAEKATMRMPDAAAAGCETGAAGTLPKGQAASAPARKQTAADRAAMVAARQSAAAAVLDLGWIGKASLPNNGRPLADLAYSELSPTAARMVKQGAKRAQYAIALKYIEKECDKVGVIPPGGKWVDFIPKDVAKRISAETESGNLIEQAGIWLNGFADSAIKSMEVEHG